MDLSPKELLRRKETLKQYGNFIENATDTLSNFCEQLGWTLDKTPTDAVSYNSTIFRRLLVKLYHKYLYSCFYIKI